MRGNHRFLLATTLLAVASGFNSARVPLSTFAPAASASPVCLRASAVAATSASPVPNFAVQTMMSGVTTAIATLGARLRNACASLVAFISIRLCIPPLAIYAFGSLTALSVGLAVRWWTSRCKEAEECEMPEPNAVIDFGAALFGATLDAASAAASAAADALTASADAAEESGEADESIKSAVATESVAIDEAKAADVEERPFIAAAKFEGAKPGYVFKAGPAGKGYYNREYKWE